MVRAPFRTIAHVLSLVCALAAGLPAGHAAGCLQPVIQRLQGSQGESFRIPPEWVRRDFDYLDERLFSSLRGDQLAVIDSYSLGAMSIYDFMRRIDSIHPRYRLGLDAYHLVWPAFRKISGMVDAYTEFKIPTRPNEPNTSTLMELITSSGKPIVFFVPREVTNHPSSFATRNELEWLLAHPERMKNVYFVFGAYNVLTDAGYASLSSALHDMDSESEALGKLFREMK